MYSRDMQSLRRVKQVIDHLKAIDTTTLTETEQDAVRECLEQAYERAAFLLQKERLTPIIHSHFYLRCLRDKESIICGTHSKAPQPIFQGTPTPEKLVEAPPFRGTHRI